MRGAALAGHGRRLIHGGVLKYRARSAASLSAGALVVAAMVWPGCSCGGDDSTSTSSGTTTSTGEGGAGGAGGGATSTSSGGGSGGAGGGAPSSGGTQASQTVSGGRTSSSPSYRMTYTFGQPTQNQGKTTSPSYRMQGGLSGANGSLP